MSPNRLLASGGRPHDVRTGWTVRWGAALGLGALWWWAVARLLLVPGAGVLEGAIAAGGWGLSLLPVHCRPKARAEGALAAGRWRRAWRAAAGAPARAVTVEPPGPRSGGGAGRR